MTATRIEELPDGLDWQAFSVWCFPNGKRHDLEAVAAYVAYKELPRDVADCDDVPANAVETWEDEGGSTHLPPRRSPMRQAGAKARPDRLPAR
jgi:hypothetical protein